MKDIESKFDKAETYIDRFAKLILKIIGTVVAIALACIFGWKQLHETLDKEGLHAQAQVDSSFTKGFLVDTVSHDTIQWSEVALREHEAITDYEIVKETFIIDTHDYRKGDTVYIDYYSDGVIEMYYTDSETYIEDSIVPIIDTITTDTIIPIIMDSIPLDTITSLDTLIQDTIN
tara:strand:+ start:6177 stop:6701 length:525 start_codon:yes stop_codon:yes gene_type:complete